jgi:DNA-binding protein HU-beta
LIRVSLRRTHIAEVLTPGKRGRYKVTTPSRVDFAMRFPNSDAAASIAAALHAGSVKGCFVNKSEMIDAIARHADISKAAAGRALDATVGAIKTSLRQGDIVTLVGFGSFYVGKRSPRAGRNPRTGDAIRIKGGKVPKFRAGKALKDALN